MIVKNKLPIVKLELEILGKEIEMNKDKFAGYKNVMIGDGRLIFPFDAALRLTYLATGCVIFLGVGSILLPDPEFLDSRLLRFLQFQFHPGAEGNTYTWFAASLLFVAAALLMFIAYYVRAFRKPWFLHWAFLATVFVFLSVDEAISLHERLGDPLRELLGTGGVLYFAWILPLGAFAILIGLIYIRFLRALDRTIAGLFVAAAAIYIFGAIGGEMGEGYVMERIGSDNALFQSFVVVEESLELLGVVLFIYALARYIRSQRIRLTLY